MVNQGNPGVGHYQGTRDPPKWDPKSALTPTNCKHYAVVCDNTQAKQVALPFVCTAEPRFKATGLLASDCSA